MDYSRIKELRIDSDTTQQELAQYLHVTRSAYSNYENGLREIPIEVLSGLADQPGLSAQTHRRAQRIPKMYKQTRKIVQP